MKGKRTATVQAPSELRRTLTARIRAAWNKSRDGIIEAGRLLIEAKENLHHGEFLAMVRSDLPFTATTCQILMKIARDPRISDPRYADILPPHWGTLHQIVLLDEATFHKAVDDGLIRPDVERKAIEGLRKSPSRPQRPAASAAWDRLWTTFGARYRSCDRAELEAELARLPSVEKLVRALIERLPAIGTVESYISWEEFDALQREARQ